MNETRVYYQWMRFEALDQWWHWLVLAMVVGAIVSYVVYWYRRDWGELPKSLGWALLILRLTALTGLLLFFFDLQKRSEQKLVVPSRLAVLVDTSLSMSLPLTSLGEGNRMDAVTEFLSKSPMLNRLQSQHDVSVYRFDVTQRPILVASFAKLKSGTDANDLAANVSVDSPWPWISRFVWAGTVLLIISILAMVIAMTARIAGSRLEVWPYVLLAGVVLFLSGLTLVGTAALRGADYPMASLWSLSEPAKIPLESLSLETVMNQEANSVSSSANITAVNTTIANTDPAKTDWATVLRASGSETRFGDAIGAILDQQQGSALAGIVLITDGQNNAGQDPVAIASVAAANTVPIYAVGVGSPDDPINVRVVDVEAPKRVFPGDRFRVSALVQSSGLGGKPCVVQLRRRSAGNSADKVSNASNSDQFAIEEEVKLNLVADDSLQPVTFDVKPRELGVWVYDVKVIPPANDANAQDNAMETEVRVIQPKSTVLVIAGGPTREYQFVRNLLFRDETVQSHVYLQTGSPGISQESDLLLTEFPKTPAEMSQYDCVLAFDADWMALSVAQVENLEKWVSNQAGGLVIIAGPVASPRWTGSSGNGDRRAEILRNLSPVILNARGSRLVSMGRFESETLWPLKLTANAAAIDFFQVTLEPSESESVWNNFPGVYSFFATYDSKPGALPLAYFSDPTASMDSKLPVYLACQFYGGGRVVFQGSGEIWRLRQMSDDYFDTYYTKLVRWASQGRLLRDSDRGMLLLDKQQALVGEQIGVRAILKDNQFQPLVLNKTTARIVEPGGRSMPIDLMPLQDASQLGVYVSQFLAKQTGTYEVQLPIGSLSDRQILTQSVAIRVPTREVQRPQRNDRLLMDLAKKTGGQYSSSLNDSVDTLASIATREQVNYLPGAPDRSFQQRLMGWFMALIATSLSLEWLLRRLSKLA